jgi:hypothetical protein
MTGILDPATLSGVALFRGLHSEQLSKLASWLYQKSTSCPLTSRGCPRAERLGSQKAAGRLCGPAIVLPGAPDLHPLVPRQLVNPKDAHAEYIRGPARAEAAFS